MILGQKSRLLEICFLLVFVRLFKSDNKIYYSINQYINPNKILSSPILKILKKALLHNFFTVILGLFRLNNSILSSHREVIRNNGRGHVQIAFSPFI